MEMMATVALKSGMELGEDATDYKGRVIIKKNTVLDKFLIQKLTINSINCVTIKEAEDYISTYFHKIKVSKTFKKFEELYFTYFTAYKDSLEAFIYKNRPMDNDDLLEIIKNITTPFSKSKTTILDMLSVIQMGEKDFLIAHGLNVALICHYTGRWFKLSDTEINTLILCGFYYDIGKFKIPIEIIRKPGKLTNEEFEMMKTHPLYGYQLIQGLAIDDNIKLATLMHHERCDGSGYPQKLLNDRINPFAKIISILDAYEAMASFRSYRPPLCPFKVIDIFEQSGLGKYDVAYYLIFLERMVEEYIGKEIMLNDGTECVVVLINKHALSRPMVKAGDNYIDLSKNKNLFIETLI